MKEVAMGVPQGSILGTILYILCVHDLQNIEFEGNNFVYADDMALVGLGTLERRTNTDWKTLEKCDSTGQFKNQ